MISKDYCFDDEIAVVHGVLFEKSLINLKNIFLRDAYICTYPFKGTTANVIFFEINLVA